MKKLPLYIAVCAFSFQFACNSSKTMSPEDWDNGSSIEKTLFTEKEVNEIVSGVLNAEHKDEPYNAPSDKIWQLEHTQIELHFNFQNKNLDGTAYLTLYPYFYPQQVLTLDAKGMDILAVEIAEQSGDYTIISKGPDVPTSQNKGPKPDALQWSYDDSLKLKITLPYIINPKESLNLKIQYQANPERKIHSLRDISNSAVSDDKGVYFINTDGKNPSYPMQVWTQGEPESNSRWFPTLDNPNQKHTHRIILNVPDSLKTISNGRLASSTVISNGYRKDIWDMSPKHAVYLTMFAIGNWEAVHDTVIVAYPENLEALAIPLTYFVEKPYKPYAKQIFGNTPEMIKFFGEFTGVPFPWNKYDQIVCREFVSGAMENTTAVIHNHRLQDPTYKMEDYISHELFHHWFGDYTTCESWSHLSMNESFACYSEYLWREHKYGKENAEEWLLDNTTFPRYSEESDTYNELKTTPLINPHFQNANQQFDDIRYNKGAQILHELRQHIGTDAFKKCMKYYLSEHAHDNGNAYDWKRSVEKVTGKNMDHFFNSWYFQGGESLVQFKTVLDPITNTSTLILYPGIAENQKAASRLKKYGRAKMQRIYIHALSQSGRTIDTAVWIYPYTDALEIKLPFKDSQVFLKYTNPQNYFYSFDFRAQKALSGSVETRIQYFLNRAHHAINNKSFSYFDKIEILNSALQALSIVEIPNQKDVLEKAFKICVASLQIDKNVQLEKPLLSKLSFELFFALTDRDSENPIKGQLEIIQKYHDLIFRQLLGESQLIQQVYFLNFLHQLENTFPGIVKQTTSKEVSDLVHGFKSSNNSEALEAALMHAYFTQQNPSNILQVLINSEENIAPVKLRLLRKIWMDSYTAILNPDAKTALIKSISAQKWPIDLQLQFLETAFRETDRESTLLLDAWVQKLEAQSHWIIASKYYFEEEWRTLQILKKQNLEQNPETQLRYSVLESLYSIALNK